MARDHKAKHPKLLLVAHVPKALQDAAILPGMVSAPRNVPAFSPLIIEQSEFTAETVLINVIFLAVESSSFNGQP